MMRSFKVAPAPARARSYAVADAERHVAEAEELWRRSSEGSSSGGGGGKVGSAPRLPRAPEDHLTLAKSAKTIMQRTTVTRQARGRSHTPKRLCTHVYSSRCQSARPYLAWPCRVPQAKSVLLDLFSRRSSDDRSHGRERHGSSERRHGSERDHGSEQLSTIPTPLRFRPNAPLDNLSTHPPTRQRTHPPEVVVAAETVVRKEALAAGAETAGKAWRTGKAVTAAARAEIRKEEAAAVRAGVMAAARAEARVETRGKEVLGEATTLKDAAQQPPLMAVEPRKVARAPCIVLGGEVDNSDEDDSDGDDGDGDDGDEDDGEDDDGDGHDGHDNAERSRLEEEALGR